MTVRADAERAAAEATARFGHVDVWINNVGRGITRPATMLTDDDIGAVGDAAAGTHLHHHQPTGSVCAAGIVRADLLGHNIQFASGAAPIALHNRQPGFPQSSHCDLLT